MFTASVPKNDRSNFLHDCTAVEIWNLIKKLDTGKATGIDDNSIEILKTRARILPQPLSVSFNISLLQGVFPD